MVESELSQTPAAILVVDTHLEVAQSMARALESDGHDVSVASSMDDALRLARESAHDLVVVGLEGEEGRLFLTGLCQLPKTPKLLIHVDSVTSPTASWAAAHGVLEVFEKPVLHRVLLDWAGRLIRRHRGEPESVTLLRASGGIGRLLGQSMAMAEVREQVLRVAEFPLMSVLICGETGTGKQLIARAIHELTCPDGPFVSLNCADIPGALFESELFGQSSGAFPDAKDLRVGLLGEAESGTLFLDEVGEMPPIIQSKLLRVLESRSFRPAGSNHEVPVRARIVSATSRRLADAGGHFRSDLYHSLAGFTLDTVPLRRRRDDIPLLAQAFLREFCRIHGRPVLRLHPSAEAFLLKHRWDGNVRELRGVIESAAVATQDSSLGAQDIVRAIEARAAAARSRDTEPAPPGSATQRSESSHLSVAPPSSGLSLVGKKGTFPSLPQLEQHVISDVFRECGQNLSLTARTLGIPRSTLRDRLKRYGLAEPKKNAKPR